MADSTTLDRRDALKLTSVAGTSLAGFGTVTARSTGKTVELIELGIGGKLDSIADSTHDPINVAVDDPQEYYVDDDGSLLLRPRHTDDVLRMVGKRGVVVAPHVPGSFSFTHSSEGSIQTGRTDGVTVSLARDLRPTESFLIESDIRLPDITVTSDETAVRLHVGGETVSVDQTGLTELPLDSRSVELVARSIDTYGENVTADIDQISATVTPIVTAKQHMELTVAELVTD